VERELTLNYKTLSGFNFENQPLDAPYACSGRTPLTPRILSHGRPSTSVLCLPENNAGLAHIVRRDLHFHFVTGHDADEVFPHLSADMGENVLAVWQRHPKHCIWQDFGDRTLDNQRFLLRHKWKLSSQGPVFKRDRLGAEKSPRSSAWLFWETPFAHNRGRLR